MSGKASISSSAVELNFDASEPQVSKKSYAKRKKIAIWVLVLLGLLAASLLIAVIVISNKLSDEKNESSRLEKLVSQNGKDKHTTKMVTEPTKQASSKKPGTQTVTGHTTHHMTPTTTEKPALGADVLLPRALIPYHYEIEIQPNIYDGHKNDFTFEGCVKIHMRCEHETWNVTLHTRDLTLDNTTVAFADADSTQNSYTIVSYTRDAMREFMVFHLNNALTVGHNYTIAMNFSGPLKKDGRGLYWSEYKRGSESRFTASTQFEQDYARKAFPSFDQPDMKASYDVSIVRRHGYRSLSNMPLTHSSNRSNDYVVDVFQRSVVMSTYLVAFLVCDYEYLEKDTSRGVKVRTWSRTEEFQYTDFALDVAVNATESYEDYLETNYTLPKQDHASIPFFNAGAMENWGLIKYRETMLLYNSHEDTESRKFSVAQVVRHELAHMWFGDLVTCKWWSDIWLNEAFASYFEVIANTYLYNEWKPYDYLLVDAQRAMNADNFPTSRPIVKEVWKNFGSMFDTITYQKGASILRQLHFIMGDGAFRRGLKRYLHRHAYGNTVTEDLFTALTEQMEEENRPDASFLWVYMNTWVKQNNYPVVHVSQQQDGSVVLRQSRYINDQTLLQNDTTTLEHEYRWLIPFTYTTSHNVNFHQSHSSITWMWPNQTEVVISNADGHLPSTNSDGWVLGNVAITGFYRVNYDGDIWTAIVNQLHRNCTVIDPRNRAQLINDAWNLADSSEIEIEQALEITDYLNTEVEYMPWYSANNEFRQVDKMLRFTEDYGIYEKYMLRKVEPVLNKLGMVNNDADSSKHLEIYVRNMMLSLACRHGSESCISHIKDLYNDWTRNVTERIDPNIRNTVYCTAVREFGEEAWDYLFEKYKTTEYPTEKGRLLYGLSCANHLWLIHKFVNKIIHTNDIEVSQQSSALVDVANNPIGRAVAVEAVIDNWEKLVNKTGFSLSSALTGISDSYNTNREYNQIVKLMQMPHLGGDLKKTLETIEKNIEKRIRWVSRFSEKIVHWMELQIGS